jgi:glycosyltransferase involved in cell wall biosynthesis
MTKLVNNKAPHTESKSIKNYDDIDNVLTRYKSLIADNNKIAAANFLADAIKQTVQYGVKQATLTIFNNVLSDDDSGLSVQNVDDLISKVGNKTNKKRLLFCSGPWLTGGMERVLSNLFMNMHDNYELYLITPFEGYEGLVELPSYVNHIKLSKYLFNESYDVIALTYALALDIDVVVGFWNLCNEQLDFYRLCHSTRIKTIAANNEMYFYPYGYPIHYNLINKRLEVFKDVDAVTWPTNFSAAAYGLEAQNSFLLPNPNTYQVQTNDIKNNEKIILCVGRFNDYIKRVDRMLECFSIVSKQIPDAKLVLVGKCNRNIPFMPHDDATINDLIKKLDIDEKNITFVGEVQNVEQYYSHASLLMLTSKNEGFGMVINEAACFGVPTVSNKIPGLDDLIIDGENGFLTEQDDIKSMAKRIIEILSDNELRNKLGNNAKRYVSKFDILEVRKSWDYMINTILENNAVEEKITHLNKRISYSIDDYKYLSKVIFNELNSVIAMNSSIYIVPHDSLRDKRSIKNYTLRLARAIKNKGVLQTSKMAVNLIKHKLHR